MPRDRKCYNKNLTREKLRVALTTPFNKGFRPKKGCSPGKPLPSAGHSKPTGKPQ